MWGYGQQMPPWRFAPRRRVGWRKDERSAVGWTPPCFAWAGRARRPSPHGPRSIVQTLGDSTRLVRRCALGFACAGRTNAAGPLQWLSVHELFRVTFVWGGYQSKRWARLVFINMSEAVGTETKVRVPERGVPNEGFARCLVYFARLSGVGLRGLLVA